MADTDADPQVPPDPIYQKSLSWHIALASLALVVAVALALVDEFWWRRPYKAVQARYRAKLDAHLDTLIEERAAIQDALHEGGEYERLTEVWKDALSEARPRRHELNVEIGNLSRRIRALNEALKSPKSELAAMNYSAEHAAAAAGEHDVQESAAARPYLDEMEAVRSREVSLVWDKHTLAPAPDAPDDEDDDEDGDQAAAAVDPAPVTSVEQVPEDGTVRDLLVVAASLQEERAALQAELAEVARPAAEALKARGAWFARALADIAAVSDEDIRKRMAQAAGERGAEAVLAELVALDVAQLRSLKQSNLDASELPPFVPSGLATLLTDEVLQIHIAEANNWVDRCETCHLGTRFPVPLTEEDMGEKLFASHPNQALLDAHDPERFGCSTCHNGNGVAITSEELAHGLNKHWLHPLHGKENYEAGCVQCHDQDLVLPMGDRITAGKDLFRHRGCWGCHPRAGFDVEREHIRDVENRLSSIAGEIGRKELAKTNLKAIVDPLYDEDEDLFNERATEVASRQQALTQEISDLRTEADVLRLRRGDLQRERKRVGPNLKWAKVKFQRAWITDWVENPQHYRPGTKMPVFRWEDGDEVKAAAAFIWQRALDPDEFPALAAQLRKQPAGDDARGRELFVARGCVACHSQGEGDARVGSEFAADLTHLGDKVNYEWVIRWLDNPRRRLVPYDLDEHRDLTQSEWEARADAPEVLWRTHSVMPSLRLSAQETRDLATFLVGSRNSDWDPKYDADAAWLDDPDLMDRGERLVKHMGCAGCHEIRGLELERGIGTNLTKEGSKPKERLDFGHYTHDAQRSVEPLAQFEAPIDGERLFEEGGKWYSHRGFFMHKLAEPDIYDHGKNIEDRFGLLRMPEFRLSGRQIHDVTSFLLGSVDAQVPESFRYDPEGAKNALQDGWWVLSKYNCTGCHQIRPGQVPSIQNLKDFADDKAPRFDDRPPSLVGTGFRTNPDWLAKFLKDPSLGGGRADPAAVRPYISVRMPSFDLTESEIRTLVRYFDAAANQPGIYQRPQMAPLTPAETRMAEAVFATDAANCMQCHYMDGVPVTSETKAPRLNLFHDRIRPEWAHRWISNPPAMQPDTQMTINFDQDQATGRWLSQHRGKVPGLDAYTGDHIWLMIRYLDTLRPARTR